MIELLSFSEHVAVFLLSVITFDCEYSVTSVTLYDYLQLPISCELAYFM